MNKLLSFSVILNETGILIAYIKKQIFLLKPDLEINEKHLIFQTMILFYFDY